MKDNEKIIHPYIPNSAPVNKERMMKEIGIRDIDELYSDIPERLRFRGKMNIPPGITSEQELKKLMTGILNRNISCEDNLSFLGGGCAQHYVPAICDEITGRAEFLTAYAGEPYEDHGRFQALFEYESLMAELLDVDVVNVPTYDWGQAASSSVRMAGRITGRREILISETVSPDRMMVIKNYCEPVMKIIPVKFSDKNGGMDLNDLKSKTGDETAGIYFENPSYLGFFEEQGSAISKIIHKAGGVVIVGTDPLSLGIVEPPVRYGADITCGDIQGLGNHMYLGGSLGGFIGTRDEEKYVMEYAWRLFGIARTSEKNEWGFGDVAYNRTSFGAREKGKEFVGTAAALYGISSAVYLSLMGPQGMSDLGKLILQNSLYARKKIATLPGVSLRFNAHFFKEFVVDFSGTGKKVEDINRYLLSENIYGGKELGKDFPALTNCALYCVTEIHSRSDIDRLISALNEALQQ